MIAAPSHIASHSDALPPDTQPAAPLSPGSQHKQEVAARLCRYRDHYDGEIARQLERMQDINTAIGKYSGMNNGARALQVLAQSLEDAQRCLGDARLAKARLELELAMWMPATGE
ncbi:hypothetical protein GGI25_002771 [Coemansia spiralis]|uniref:Uncharacterized protein n=2 Tax=Coemansia TaxID=4863 RepID=A0A9W8G3D8_9FUNG|nr:hypothetical protein EDC05_002110 [Coemansia umbellata]KAJ2625274.1 hypothetical protein GGI26_000744 [Coemansia sp. RSA 1358]KAJ2677981.1 hypothetical protein GGI25_002771 [Coemansia spiralis]